MKNRSRLRRNLQCRAFELFSRGRNTLQVSEDLRITISDARKYRQFFLQSEVVSPEGEKEITEFLEEGYRKERENSISELFSDLQKKEDFSTPGNINSRLRVVMEYFPGVEEAFLPFGNLQLPSHFVAEGESRLLDKIDEICNN